MCPTASDADHIATVASLPIDTNTFQSSFWISRKRKRGQSEPVRRALKFPLLLEGKEPGVTRDLRRDTFEALWNEQETAINVTCLSFMTLRIGHFGDISREDYRRPF
jgi:hypothetical protein